MINFIPKEQLEAAGKATIASHNLLQINQKYRKKYNEVFNIDERYYLRTIRNRFVKWEKTEYPDNFCCRCKENKGTLLRIIQFYKRNSK